MKIRHRERMKNTSDLNPNYFTAGLNTAEIEQRKRSGQVNEAVRDEHKSLPAIIRDHLFTSFNLLNAILALLVLIVAWGETRYLRNILFIIAALINTIIGIVQEYRSRRAVAKLKLITSPQATVIRNGRECHIANSELVKDDLLLVKVGNQLVVDGDVLEAKNFALDESMLTGEADEIVKQEGEAVLSGSFVVSGKAKVRATKVGVDTYSAQLLRDAKTIKANRSEIMRSLSRVIRYLGLVLLVVGTGLLISKLWLFSTGNWRESVISIVAALVGMIPQGLILLTSVAFVVSVYRLAKRQTLAHDKSSIETLARVDMLCFDKTGTLTTGEMAVENVRYAEPSREEEINSIIYSAFLAQADHNATARAVIDYFAPETKAVAVASTQDFSSKRKYAQAEIAGKSYFFGAAEILFPQGDDFFDGVAESRGLRVLAVGYSNTLIADPEEGLLPLAAVEITDCLQQGIGEMLNFFQEQDVQFKLISGDNPVTVQAIARQAGLKNIDNCLDLSTVAEGTDLSEWRKLVEQYNVFGRVTPFQKKQLVQALRANGHVVAMTGDGVNDVPALKQADCGVAMATGTDAAKTTAQLVLADNDMQGLIYAVQEGRRVINNIERVATLFLTKTVYAVLLSICFIFIRERFPIFPIQFTLISTLAIGMPAYFLALRPNQEIVRGRFIAKVLETAIPAGLTVTLLVLIVQFGGDLLQVGQNEKATLIVHLILVCSLIVLSRVCAPWDEISIPVYSLSCFGALFAVLFMRQLFMFTALDFESLLLLTVMLPVSFGLLHLLQWAYRRLFSKRVQ